MQIRDIVNNKHCVSTTVVSRRYSTVLLSASCVPDLQLNSLSVLYCHYFVYELYSDSNLSVFSVGVFYKPLQYVTFTDVAIAS